jgi:hypothetical protein
MPSIGMSIEPLVVLILQRKKSFPQWVSNRGPSDYWAWCLTNSATTARWKSRSFKTVKYLTIKKFWQLFITVTVIFSIECCARNRSTFFF